MQCRFIENMTLTRILNPKYHGNLIGGLHAHKNDYQLIYIEKGSGSISIENNTYTVSSHDLICIYPNQLHRSNDEAPGYFELIEILWYFKEAIQPELNLNPVMKLKPGSQIVRSLQRLVKEALLKRREYKILMKIIMSDILVQLERLEPDSAIPGEDNSNSSSRYRVKKVLEYIHLHYRNDISLDDLSEIAGVSSPHLCRIFPRITNYSPINYLIKIRLDIAVDLLKNSDYTISEIAEMVGFEDIYYFSRVFKKWKGMPPRKFREA
ncbi:helix-turn-helix transcriptional regulator [candidate division KSB1 bacterium]|nr:helix-turn-helix transcriptional regulator [candidate division KSB1 bacterium]